MSSFDLLNTTSGGEGLIPFADRLEARLTPLGALNLLAVAIRIAPHQQGLELISAALRDLSAGQPGVALFSIADEAKRWASLASLAERKYYVAAIFNTFGPSEKEEFLGFADRRAA